jgi:AcrR family transcriptional regulator
MVQNKEGADAKRRGRPRAYDPAVALARAREVFWRHGYSGTSLDEISAATGMNRPSLSAAFGDKRAIYLAALRDYWVTKVAAMDQALGVDRLEEALLRLYDISLSLYFADEDDGRGCFVVGTAITEAVDDAEVRAITQDGFARLDAKFVERFARAREAGELGSNADIETLASLATATLHTMAVRARSGTPCKTLHALARKAVAMICR